MTDDDMRPRPVPPPSESRHSGRRPDAHRSVGALWAGTFRVVGKRWRDLAVAATLGAALWLVAFVSAYVGADELFDGKFWEKLDALFDGEIETAAEVDAWMASFEFTFTPQAAVLLLVALIASFFSILQAAASAQIARQELTGIDAGGSTAASIALSRLPALLLINVALIVVQAVLFLVGLGLTVVADPLGAVWDLVTLVVSVVIAPLLTILWVMVYVEPGLPSLRRWNRLLGRNKLATWGRVMLFDLVRMVFAAVVFLVVIASPLSFAYSLAIVVVLVWPVTVGIVTVAHVIMYGDLVSALSSDGRATDGDHG
ncbi:hypothetical protein [Candidatus Poriferisodalis sp.]|uniref:hypothetical protein n=1 Tax=Candidatus Poriferisodalis sp. TaxID=3101277 RepID=UPI003B59564F